MLFAFLILPHGSSLRSSRNPLVEAGNGQPGRCPCLCSPAGSATARLVEVGTGGRSSAYQRTFPGRVCLTLAAARQKNAIAHGCHRFLLGAIFQSPQTPIGAFTRLWQVHTDPPATTAKTSCIRVIIVRGYRDIELPRYFCHLSLQDVFLSNKNPL